VRALAVALVLWTIVVAWVVLASATPGTLLDCMHLVGRPAACEQEQEAVNRTLRAYQTLPMILSLAGGYVGIGTLRLASVRGARARGAG
jgi:hypothetical protein